MFGLRKCNFNLGAQGVFDERARKWVGGGGRGGEKRGGTRAKRVDENSGFANLQLFHKNVNSIIKPQP